MGYFRILSAIPGYFVSSFFVMILWGVIAPHFGAVTIGYPMALLITITLWLAVAPLAVVQQHRSGHVAWHRETRLPPQA